MEILGRYDLVPGSRLHPLDGVFQATYAYTSPVNYALTLDPYTVQKGYGILNLSAGMQDPHDRYKVTLFVNNVLDKHYHPDIRT